MVVGFVLEQEQPVLHLAVYIALDLDGAGVDFLTLVKVFEDPALLERFRADRRAVHQGAVLFVTAGLGAQRHVPVKRSLHNGVVDLDIVKDGAEGRVPAVVAPVGVDDLDLGDGRVAVLALEVILAEHDVGVIHRKAALDPERFKRLVVEGGEAGQRFNGRGDRKLHLERLALIQARFSRFNRVDDVLLDGGKVFGREIALQQIDPRAAHVGALALAQQLDALAGRVRPLVKLAGQILHRKDGGGGGQRVIGQINRRFAENRRDGLFKQVAVDALDIVPVEQPQTFERGNAQKIGQLGQQALGLAVKAGLLFDINAVNHENLLIRSAAPPARGGQCRCACAPRQNGCAPPPRKRFSALASG